MPFNGGGTGVSIAACGRYACTTTHPRTVHMCIWAVLYPAHAPHYMRAPLVVVVPQQPDSERGGRDTAPAPDDHAHIHRHESEREGATAEDMPMHGVRDNVNNGVAAEAWRPAHQLPNGYGYHGAFAAPGYDMVVPDPKLRARAAFWNAAAMMAPRAAEARTPLQRDMLRGQYQVAQLMDTHGGRHQVLVQGLSEGSVPASKHRPFYRYPADPATVGIPALVSSAVF